MAAKKQKYTITRRFEVWVDMVIDAKDLDEAYAEAKQSKFTDFFNVTDGAGIVDWEAIPGTGVREEWE